MDILHPVIFCYNNYINKKARRHGQKIKTQMSFTKKVLGLFFVGMFLVGGVVKAQTAADLQAQIASLMAQIKALQAQLNTISSPSEVWCHTFNKNLKIGDNNEEVSYLRMALLKDGFLENESSLVQVGNPSTENNFNESTSAGVTGFQQKYASEILTPVGLKYGTGFVGAGTRAKLNKLYGCGNTMPPIACTMDAKQCPDGTYVSRTGPKCEFASCPIYKSVTVTSPNGGEVWAKGTTQTIKWYDNFVTAQCPAGTICPEPTRKSYNIILLPYNQLCTESTCTQPVDREKYTIATNVFGSSYDWMISTNLEKIYGQYKIYVCRSSESEACDSSNSYFTIPSSSIDKAITVISPNGGETLVKGKESIIRWQDNSSVPTCPVGVYCVSAAPRTYDIKLVPYTTPCAGNVCPMNMVRMPYTISKNVSGLSYNWEAGRVWDDSQYAPDGSYLVEVCRAGSDVCDSSDTYFKITSNSGIGLPIISGVSGPATLAVGQQGTWTVKAYDPNNGTLSYSVVWGDETSPPCAYGTICATAAVVQPQQTATFTHVYGSTGYYSPKFTVANTTGGSAVTTISVKVGEVSIPITPDTIQVLYPQATIELLRDSLVNLYWIQSNVSKNVDLKLVPTSRIAGSTSYNIISGLAPRTTKEQTYSWSVGSVTSVATSITLIPDGEYYLKACYSGTDVCGTSKYTLNITTPGLILPQTSAVTNNAAQTASLLESMKATLEKMMQSLY